MRIYDVVHREPSDGRDSHRKAAVVCKTNGFKIEIHENVAVVEKEVREASHVGDQNGLSHCRLVSFTLHSRSPTAQASSHHFGLTSYTLGSTSAKKLFEHDTKRVSGVIVSFLSSLCVY